MSPSPKARHRHAPPLARHATPRLLICAATLLVAASSVAIGCGPDPGDRADRGGGDGRDRFDAERAFADLEAQVERGPRPAGSPPNRATARWIAAQLRAAGARGVRVQRPHRNVVATLPGPGADGGAQRERSGVRAGGGEDGRPGAAGAAGAAGGGAGGSGGGGGAILIAAHHDTAPGIPGFVGANDGASGVAVVLELARSLARRRAGPPVRVALFDAEEARPGREFERDGMRGSRQYVEYSRRAQQRGRAVQGTPPLDRIAAMVLFDLVGDCELQIPREGNSDPQLYGRFAAAAAEAGGDPGPFTGTARPILDDHIPFLEAGIPAVDLIDFAYGPGPSPGEWWHSPEDTTERVCAASLDAVGEAAVRAVSGLG